MSASAWICRFHRALAIVFMLAAVANLAVQGRETLAFRVGVLTLVPLALLLLGGLYLFALPHAMRWRGTRVADRHAAQALRLET